MWFENESNETIKQQTIEMLMKNMPQHPFLLFDEFITMIISRNNLSWNDKCC